jgi:hypothetical protein
MRTAVKMSPSQLARAIRKLPVKAPITERLEIELPGRWRRDLAWYSSQKEHWLGWLSEYDGPGAYERKSDAVRSAEFAYNHIVCAPMLLWLAEASGVPASKVATARRAAMAAPANLMSQSAAIRRALPWREVEVRLR